MFLLFLIILLFLRSNAVGAEPTVVKSWNSISQMDHATIVVQLSKTHDDRYDLLIDFGKSNETCASEEKINQSSSILTDRVIKTVFGPDEMIVNIVGKELLALIPKYVSCGKYLSSFHLLLPGAYHLKLSRTRGKYTALNEMVQAYPQVHLEYLVSDWVELVGSKAKSSVCHHSNYGSWVLKSLLPLSSDAPSVFDSVNSAQKLTPIDYKINPIPGVKSFVSIGTDHAEKGCFELADLYSYEPVTGCPWTHISAEEAGQILSHKRLSLMGDSHMRNFVKSLLRWACDLNTTVEVAKAVDSHFAIPIGAKSCSGLQLNYYADYFCSVPGHLVNRSTDDLFVVNCGQHPASRDRWTADQYRSAINNLTNHVLDSSVSGLSHKNFVWMETNPEPLRNDGWIISFGDWRSEHRLMNFNDISSSIMLSHHYEVLHSFNSLLPYVETACDIAHFTAPGLLYPEFLQYFHLLKERSSSHK